MEKRPVYYSPKKWRDYGVYYVYEEEKDTIGYRQARKGRVTGSIVSACIGNSLYDETLETLEDIADQIAGIKPKAISPEAQARIDYGTAHENDARIWYIRTYGVQVIEKEFAVPKFDPRIGMAPDGMIISNSMEIGLLEIKCCQKFYRSIETYITVGRPYTETYSHIYRSHYDQMQMGMAIFNKEWCDYLVFCIPENKVFIERVIRNRKYWDEMYLRINWFINNLLNPKLKSIGSKYPMIPK